VVPATAALSGGEPLARGWRAEFSDGQSAVTHAVVVTFEQERLTITDAALGAPLASWGIASAMLDELQEGVAFVHSPEQRFAVLEVRDPALLSELRSRARQAQRLPGGQNRRTYAIACLALITILGGGFYWSVPLLSRWVAQRVPIEYERELGAAVLPVLASEYCDSAEALAALAALKARLDPGDEVSAELHVIDASMVNAFALPGGIVVLTRGLLEKAGNADEVAGVLAHELEHVRQRHVLSHMVRSSLLSAAWSVAVGDYAGLMLLDPTTAFEIANLRHSRSDEAEADSGAMLHLDTAGISRQGLIDFFERIRADTDVVPEWLSSHPASEQRAHGLAAQPRHAETHPALTPEAFDALQRACGE
jgi:beta-barrel assembly-enhancing protease